MCISDYLWGDAEQALFMWGEGSVENVQNIFREIRKALTGGVNQFL